MNQLGELTKSVKVGLLGFGLSGRVFHAPFLQAHGGFEITMVSSSRAEEVRLILPQAEVVAAPEQVLNNPEIELVINCAPNQFHYTLTAAALEAGKHVVVEKPFVTSINEGKRLIALAEQKSKVLSVFHNRRWDSDFLTVKKLLATNALGEIQQFESHMDRWRPEIRAGKWKEQPLPGSGLFYDLGVHLMDQTLQLFGTPEKVFADIQCQKIGASVDDYFHVIFYYGKKRAILHGSSFAATTARFQLFGDKANFTKFGLDPQEDQLKEGLSPTHPNFGVENERIFGELFNPKLQSSQKVASEKGNYQAFYDGLYRTLTQTLVPPGAPVLPTEALEAIRMIELARESSARGRVMTVTDATNSLQS